MSLLSALNPRARPVRSWTLPAVIGLTLLASTHAGAAQPAPTALIKPGEAAARMSPAQAREADAYTLGVQTVIWGMQWVKAGAAMSRMSTALPAGSVPSAEDRYPHAINRWGHANVLATHLSRTVETANTETLYSVAVVDLQDGPVVVVHPEHAERYFRTTVWDVRGDTHTISQKQDGSHPAPYALLPVDWDGTLPAGMKSIRAAGRYVLLAPHIAVYGEDDLPKVHALQKGYKLFALKDYGVSNAPLTEGQPMRPLRRADSKTPAQLAFFEMLGEVLKDMQLREEEAGFARQAERIGLTLKDGFQFERLDADTVRGLERAVVDAQSIIENRARVLLPVQPGGTWQFGGDVTTPDDWLLRGAVGWKHVWGDLASEILYPMARNDGKGQPLTGQQQYQLTFPAGQMPAARYWRISMYDLDGFFVDNPIQRYGLGNMAEQPKLNPDGSLTLYIQHDSPGANKQANWLPTPKDGFFMVMRLYQPQAAVYSGDYIVPPVMPGH